MIFSNRSSSSSCLILDLVTRPTLWFLERQLLLVLRSSCRWHIWLQRINRYDLFIMQRLNLASYHIYTDLWLAVVQISQLLIHVVVSLVRHFPFLLCPLMLVSLLLSLELAKLPYLTLGQG